MPVNRHLRLAIWTFSALLLVLAWDALALDLPLARLSGSSLGFPLRESWLLSTVLHEDARRLSWGLMFALILAIWWPVGALRQLSRGERAGLVSGTLLALLAVSALKSASHTRVVAAASPLAMPLQVSHLSQAISGCRTKRRALRGPGFWGLWRPA